MPSPRRKGESEETFVQRCLKEVMDEYPDISQRYAVCKSYAARQEKKMKQEELFVLTPRKTENRGLYLTRCSKHDKIKSQFKDLKERLNFCMTSFNEYYKYWAKMEYAKVPENTALGQCIAKEKAKGFTYQEAYAHCASRIGTPPLGAGQSIVLSDNTNLLIEPVMFEGPVSIDFDDTLSTERGQEMAKKMLEQGIDLHIVTRRNKSESGDVYKIAEKLGIPKDKVHFTEGKLKWETIKALGIKKHIDNNPKELEAISSNLPDVDIKKFAEGPEMDIFGYKTKFFYICPGAQATFSHLMEMTSDDDDMRMIRNAAVLADKVFEMEAKVLEDKKATQEQLDQATLIVNDFYELMDVIDDRLDMVHDVSYMDGHLEKISSLI